VKSESKKGEEGKNAKTIRVFAFFALFAFFASPLRSAKEAQLQARRDIITPSLAITADSAYIFADWSNQQSQIITSLKADRSVLKTST